MLNIFKLKKKAGALRVHELLKVKESAIFKENPIKTLLSRENIWMVIVSEEEEKMMMMLVIKCLL